MSYNGFSRSYYYNILKSRFLGPLNLLTILVKRKAIKKCVTFLKNETGTIFPILFLTFQMLKYECQGARTSKRKGGFDF